MTTQCVDYDEDLYGWAMHNAMLLPSALVSSGENPYHATVLTLLS